MSLIFITKLIDIIDSGGSYIRLGADEHFLVAQASRLCGGG
jgi:hypothetical protein